ncbi:MAG: hypothetical protein WAV60_08165, partial [Anaerolineae bacterium]
MLGYFKVGDAGSQDGFYTFLQFRHFVYFFMHRLLRHAHHLCYSLQMETVVSKINRRVVASRPPPVLLRLVSN